MHAVRTYSVAALAAMIVLSLLAPPARAQAPTTLRVAIANPARIFNEIRETKDLQSKFAADLAGLQEQAKARELKLRDLQSARDTIKPDSPQYNERNDELVRMAIEYEVWKQTTQRSMERQQKERIKNMFDRITETVTKIAQQKGIDLVIAEVHPDIPENLDSIQLQDLRNRLISRNILYNTDVADITNEVIAALDAQYTGGAGAGGTTQPPPGGPAGGGQR